MASDTRKVADRRSINVPSTSSNMLNGRSFLLELDNRREFERVATSIRRFGGHIVDTYMEEKLPMVVISDHCLAAKIEQKKVDIENPTEKLLKAMPALLREAAKRKIKIRTVETFMKQLSEWAQKSKKASSATNSTGVMHRRQSLQNSKKTFENSKNGNEKNGKRKSEGEKGFIRIEVPGKKPDVRAYDKASIEMIYTGCDTGHCVFKKADMAYASRKANDMNLFIRGMFRAPKKANYKLEDEEVYCQFCGIKVTKMAEHERTDQHRNKVRHQGIVSEMERVVMSARLAINTSNKNTRKRNLEESENEKVNTTKRITEYAYGENRTRIVWKRFRRRGDALTVHNEEDDTSDVNDEEKVEKSQPPPVPRLPGRPIFDPRVELLTFCGFPNPRGYPVKT